MIIKYMLKHDFAKKKEKKTMLYIFRYFKEIQISIFVIKTMFEIFLIGTCDNVREDISYLVSSFLFC